MASAPERSCAVCRKRLPQAQLQRWTVTAGVAELDSQQGRGYYSCPECADKAKIVIEGRARALSNKRRT